MYACVIQTRVSAVCQSYQICSYCLNSAGGILLHKKLFLTSFFFLLYKIYIYIFAHISVLLLMAANLYLFVLRDLSGHSVSSTLSFQHLCRSLLKKRCRDSGFPG